MTVNSDERLVELYVYDLSQGLARQFSLGFLGIQIDAVYHTSIVVGGREYYYGQGIQYSQPGKTHHGPPMEVIQLGTTFLPDETIWEYLDSLKSIYSPEAYDLFFHNCNNFSDTVAQFLCGCGIPKHITSLPQTVLNTPFGQMLKPQLDQALRGVTQAPGAGSFQQNGSPGEAAAAASSQASKVSAGRVRVASSLAELERNLADAKEKCAAVFFTSATCPPCKIVYPHFEQLAAEAGEKAVFVKVDIGTARDVSMKYQISATPTFMTFMKGEKADEWKGASPSDLKSNIGILLQMTYPPHPHSSVRLPVTLSTSMTSVSYSKIPPLDKVVAKLGALGQDPSVQELKSFLAIKASEGSIEAPLPNLSNCAKLLQSSCAEGSVETLFPLVDLFRAALSDARVSGWFAEEKDHATIKALLTCVTTREIPYSLRLVTLQATCNLFSSSLFPPRLTAPPLSALLISLITSSLLDKAHVHSRVAASSLCFNTAVYVQKMRSIENHEVFSDTELVELVAGVIESVKEEGESSDVVRGLVLSLALLMYCVPLEGETREMLKVLEAGEVVRSKGKGKLGDKKLCTEVATLLEA